MPLVSFIPGSLKPAANLPSVSLTPVANLPQLSTTLAILVAKFAPSVLETGGKPPVSLIPVVYLSEWDTLGLGGRETDS